MFKQIAATATLGLLTLTPAAMAAGNAHGTLLSVNRKAHTIEVVDGSHAVHSYHYRGKLPALALGARLSFQRSGNTLSHVKAAHGSSVSFLARVERDSSNGVVLRLADGRSLSLSSAQLNSAKQKSGSRHIKKAVMAHMAADMQVAGGGVTVNIQGLQPGLTVLVTETTDAAGALDITITLPPASTPAVSGEQASGVIAAERRDAFALQTADDSMLLLHMAAATLASSGVQPCDEVKVTYHQDNDLLIVDSVTKTGTSTSGDCADSSGSDSSSQGGDNPGDGQGDSTGDSGSTTGDSGSSSGSDNSGSDNSGSDSSGSDNSGSDNSGSDSSSQDETGMITAVSATILKLSTPDGQRLAFVVKDPSLVQAFHAGDVVDVTYDDSGSVPDVTDVQYVEQDVAGEVTDVSGGSITLAPVDGSQAQTFSADPAANTFTGVSTGDVVDVIYHVAAGQQVAEKVQDLSSAPAAP